MKELDFAQWREVGDSISDGWYGMEKSTEEWRGKLHFLSSRKDKREGEKITAPSNGLGVWMRLLSQVGFPGKQSLSWSLVRLLNCLFVKGCPCFQPVFVYRLPGERGKPGVRFSAADAVPSGINIYRLFRERTPTHQLGWQVLPCRVSWMENHCFLPLSGE